MTNFKQFTIVSAQHAPLYKRYDLNASSHVTVGDVEGRFGREDGQSGAEYRCLAEERDGKLFHSTDLKCGAFYPHNVFIWGLDGDGKTLPFEAVEAFCKEIHHSNTSRVLLPKGWERGQNTWFNALTFTPVERKPYLLTLADELKSMFPKAEIIYDRHDCLTISTWTESKENASAKTTRGSRRTRRTGV